MKLRTMISGSVLAALSLALIVLWYPRLPTRLRPDRLQLPAGFEIDLFARNLGEPRSLAVSDAGTVFTASRSAGWVIALGDSDGDFVADRIDTVATGLTMPNGVAFHRGDLFVAELHRVVRFTAIESRLARPGPPAVIYSFAAVDTWHGWKYLRVGPDGKLYVPIGAPCNVCDPDQRGFARILRMNLDGSDVEVFARGVRNTVGFDWHPETRELWFTDNGRDWMGADEPPDELNRAPIAGLHFGFPFCHSGIPDPEFTSRSCSEFTSPAQELDPHVAALGMRFYTGEMFPDEYRGAVFIAEHGSWNRLVPVGYRISLVRLESGVPVSYAPFATGWLRLGRVSGRPVDVAL
ncbi:MAG: PQQ-dependent sugar dehydrogenase, partial [Gemmatimonadales bacterium]